MRLAFKLSTRYFRAGGLQIVLVIFGMAVGAALSVLVSSMLNGAQANLIYRTLGQSSHITFQPRIDIPQAAVWTSTGMDSQSTESRTSDLRPPWISDWKNITLNLRSDSRFKVVSPIVSFGAGIEKGRALENITVRGVEPDSESKIVDFRNSMVSGCYRIEPATCIMGKSLANKLGLRVGDHINIKVAKTGMSKVFKLAGLYTVGIQQIDEQWVLVTLEEGQHLDALHGNVNLIETQLNDVFSADKVAHKLSLQYDLDIHQWKTQNAQTLNAIVTEDSVNVIITAFVYISMTLGIASVLFVMVLQRSKEIGILKSMGLGTTHIALIFIFLGFLIGLAGSASGVATGVGVASYLASIPGKTYHTGKLFPVAMTSDILIRVSLLAVLASTLAAVPPAIRAARLDPIEVIRNG
jgi:lipoprotein-releasing system permease protein